MGGSTRVGLVTGLSPVEVRFWGASVSVPVDLVSEDVTLSTDDKVLLVEASGSWVIVCVLAST